MNLIAMGIVATALAQEPSAVPRESADAQELSRLETAWNEAHMRGDADVLDRLLAEDLVLTVPNMATMAKPDAIGAWRSGRIRFQRYESSDLRIRVYGDAGVVTGRLQRTRNTNGRVVDDDWRFTKVYVRRAGQWRVVAFHASPSPGAEVKVVPHEAERRVDVLVDGKPFTSYTWPERLKKPVLYPLRTARGTVVTRGFPLDPRPGERVDHPHHVGMWFNHGDVNGVDFWNNSEALKPEDQAKMGVIRHRQVVAARDGKDKGELEVEADWVMPDGSVALRERTLFVFRADADGRSVDRVTTLTAGDKKVVFKDNKEGTLGIRVARALEQPADKPEVFTDASGKPTSVPVLDHKGVTGQYLSSEGLQGDKVWGTRGRWASLTGTVEGEAVTLAILDHPQNPGFPTYWHARGYGLFAANPLGQKIFSEGKEQLNFAIAPGASATFRYRVVIASGTLAPTQVEERYREFARP